MVKWQLHFGPLQSNAGRSSGGSAGSGRIIYWCYSLNGWSLYLLTTTWETFGETFSERSEKYSQLTRFMYFMLHP